MSKEKQVYEEYWKYTAAWTNINSQRFIQSMEACVKYFSEHSVNEKYRSKDYTALQQVLVDSVGFGKTSARKAINQFVKLGFLKPRMRGLNSQAYDFIHAKNDSQRAVALSKAVYINGNFQSSMKIDNCPWQGQVGFLIKTLEECKKLTKDNLISLMTYDFPSRGDKEYLTSSELDTLYQEAQAKGFASRKYNQVSHLMNLLNKLDNLKKIKGVIYFEEDARNMFGDDDEIRALKQYRDPYLQRMYKKDLISESDGYCMVEHVEYPVLIASHIRPYSNCRDCGDAEAAFDPNNGLLLSKSLDSLFDLGYITFDNNGCVIASNELKPTVLQTLTGLKLDSRFINEKRMRYMEYHRKAVFNVRFKKNQDKQVTL